MTDKMLTEKYITLPAGFLMKGKPEITYTKYVMVTENTTFYINNPSKNASDKYYIYAYGGITGSSSDAAMRSVRRTNRWVLLWITTITLSGSAAASS